MSIMEIQFPIGEGGLHLGLIGKTAYIYDCGCCCSYIKKSQLYILYFNEIKELLENKEIKDLKIYISHMHEDHCNLLSEFLNVIKSNKKLKIEIFIPKITSPEKVFFFTN